MNILHEVNQLDCGGVEKVVRNIIKFDKQNKHYIISYADGSYRKALEDAGATIFLYDKEKEIEIELTPDIIHIHTGGGKSDIAESLGKQFPVVETIHSPVRSRVPDELVKQRIGVSDVVAAKNKNCITIKNGIDLTAHALVDKGEAKKKIGLPPDKTVIGRLGRLGHDKGLEEWLLVCHRLQKEGVDFIPLIVGDEARNCGGYRGRLKLMAESLPVKGIVWAGLKLDTSDYYNAINIFLYPSRTEGFGLVFAEAMLHEDIIVTINNDVNREVCAGYGILTEDSIPGLVSGAKKALLPEVRDAIASCAPAWVESEFDAERMSKDYQDIYGKLLVHRQD